MHYDAIVIGGSYAGLAAATQLARARRRILVVDGGQRRNRFAEHSHGFLTQDGTPAADIAAQGRAQLMAYPTVQWREGQVTTAERAGQGFRIEVDGAVEAIEARRLVLATGVIDHLPEVPGLAERWGRHVFHCPYCHGYELNQGRLGALGVSPLSMHVALMLPDWGQATLFLNGAFEPDADQLAQLQARGVALERGLIDRIEGAMDIVMRDGRLVPQDGLFTLSRVEVASPVAAQLGCEFEDGPLGRTIKTDFMKATTVPGVYACGDAARQGGSLPLAVGDGTMAGAATHQSLIFGGH
ncbi:thioredoxin reductase [Acidovorax sp. CF316]|uniref:NAD(P)/FAD-dependent oxidoreductase n=1 Tax=Acidovorax sp. CF316 TaxID=1144317 RepID=UPI00026BED85|nr:NAD(P)/FAD-dependent oxidoreductase [Acidovorax sp. CF316]EJE54742.1 thioredoxin reductase [Acidovorax sp. CF316]